MLDSFRDVKFRTILFVAVAVWAALLVVWYLVSNEAPVLKSATVPEQAEPAEKEEESVNSVEPNPSPRVEVSVGDQEPREVNSDTTLAVPVRDPRPGEFVVQAGSFSSQKYADRLSKELQGYNLQVFIEEIESGNQKLYRVCVGPFATKGEADQGKKRIDTHGLEGFIRQVQ